MDICSVGVPTFFTRAEAWECDHNEHWNVRQYLRVFRQAGYVASDMCGNPPLSQTYTQHTRYHRELVQTSPVEIRSATLADGDLAGATVHILNSNGRLSATAITQPGVSGAALPMVSSADVALALPRGVDGSQHVPETAPLPANAKIVEHGFVQPRETDHTATLSIDFLMGRIAAASNDLLGGLGFTPDFVKENQMSRMGVETKITTFQSIPVGTRLQSVVRVARAGGKNILLRHRFFTTDNTPVAAVDQSLVTVDMKTRRATELPDFLKVAADSV